MARSHFFKPALVLLLACMLAALVILPGCGEDKQAMQDFVDGYIAVMEKLESQPEVAEGGRDASMAYYESGFTDLDSADKAADSYEKSSENDQAALRDLKALEKPDADAREIASELELAVIKIDEGNQMFASKFSGAKDQSVEERAAAAQDIGAPMGLYAEGMAEVVSSLSALEDYIEKNGLKKAAEAKKWRERISSELEAVEQSSSQQ